MFNAFRSNKCTETDLKRLEDRIDSKIELVKTEWRQYLVSIEDVHDKIDHIVKRRDKRRQRAEHTPDTPEQEPDLDPVSTRVAERRQHRGVSAQ